jgi:hypothetical protein
MSVGRQSGSPPPSTTANVTIERIRLRAYYPLRPAPRITSLQLRVSSSMNLPKSAAVPPCASSPRASAVERFLNFTLDFTPNWAAVGAERRRTSERRKRNAA